MCTVTDNDLAWPPCAGEGLRDVIAEHAITLLADWDEERPVSRSAGDPPKPIQPRAESAGGDEDAN